jgi:sugar lactone lactonase YvrE
LLLLLALAAALGFWWWARTRPPRPLAVISTLGGAGPRMASNSDALSDPFGVAVDRDGLIFVTDGAGGRLYRIDENGTVALVVAGLEMPSALAAAPDGTLVIANTGRDEIIRVDPEKKTVRVMANSGLSAPVGVAVGHDGRVFVADTYGDRICEIDAHGAARTIAGGSGPGYADGQGEAARFDTPCGIAIAPDGALLVADTGNHRLRRVTMDGTVTTLAGTGEATRRDGALSEAAFDEPIALAVRRDGALFVADAAGSALRLIVFGEGATVTTLAGGSADGLADGENGSARINRPIGLAFTPDDALVFADSGNGLVRACAPRGLRLGFNSAPGAARLDAAEIRAAVEPRWPFDPPEARREIAGTFGEVRGEVLPEREAWFHSGLDIPGAYGETVRALYGERVARPLAVDGFGGVRERLRLPVFGYIHLRVGRDAQDRPLAGIEARGFSFRRDEKGTVVGVRVRRGARIEAGDTLGTLNRLNHVHLVAGQPGAEVNALAALRLPGLSDTRPPFVEGIDLTDEAGAPLEVDARGRALVRTRVRIIARSYDQADGGAPYRRLGIYRLAYQVLKADGAPAEGFERARENLVFERLPADPRAVALAYAEGSQSGYEGRTIFAYLVTNVVRDGEAREDFWDPSTLAPGDYKVRVIAADFFGNQTRRDVPVTIAR